jgi:cytochrome bd ubiquinol oxidase subunit II
MSNNTWLPVVFMALMGFAMWVYVVLDGFDLGVGMLMSVASDDERDVMVSSIGPFWDANETWLVLGVGLLLIAFPKAHGLILSALYLPVALMLMGLILRGVAFDFRVKARDQHRALWNRLFIAGSALASVAQGWMLGRYVTGFAPGVWPNLFAVTIALCLPAAYALLGATWLIIKTEGNLQQRAARWAHAAWWPFVVGMLLISVATPLVSATVRERWFAMPHMLALAPIPLATAAALWGAKASISTALQQPRWHALPFGLMVFALVMGACGLAYSLFPFVVMDQLTVWQAASSQASLEMILIGCAITVPAILGYTVFSYRVFHGKASALTYG